MRYWIALVGLLLVACSGGSCDKDSGTTGPSIPKVVAQSPIGYSNVSSLTAGDVRIVAERGLTLVQAELTNDHGVGDVDGRSFPRIIEAVAAARASRVTFFLTLVNWNGAVERAQSDAWFSALLDRVIREIGPAGVWVEGVSEPDGSDKAARWIRMTRERWPGTLVVNGQGGHGSASGGILDWHYCDYAGLLQGVRTTDRLHSTDCGPVLASRLSEAQVKEVTKLARDLRRKLILYDTSFEPAFNPRVAQWMAEALQDP